MRNRFFCEQAVLQFARKPCVFAPNPLQQHGSVLFLLVSIVRKDCLELHVLACISTLEECLTLGISGGAQGRPLDPVVRPEMAAYSTRMKAVDQYRE